MQGLSDVFKDKLPNANNRYCVKHLYGNVTSKFKGKRLKDIVWKAAYANILREFDNWMKKIEKLKVDAYNYLNYLDPRCWSRSHFNPEVKCDVLVNNLNESQNLYILKVKEMPILQMLEWIRRKVMLRLQIKKDGIKKYKGLITHTTRDK